jgi:hypothetical protein
MFIPPETRLFSYYTPVGAKNTGWQPGKDDAVFILPLD